MVLLPSERATREVKERAKATGIYGPPAPIYAGIAKLWSAYTGIELTATDVAFMQALLKIGRENWGNHNEDNYTDVAGYANLAEMVHGA